MSDNKAGTLTSVGTMASTPPPNNGNEMVQVMITVADANDISASFSQLAAAVTPKTVTTTAAMTQPHPSTIPQIMARPRVSPSSPIPQVQVIQQPIHAPAYLQHIYNNPQQQLFMSADNITLQPTAMSPSIQITPQMMLATAGKPILQGQSNYIPNTSNQIFNVIGQQGVISSQPSLTSQHHSKAVSAVQEVKPYVLMGQATALQPKSSILPHSQSGTAVSVEAGVTATAATILNSSQFNQTSQGTATIVSTPQLVTSQADMIVSQAHQLLNPLHTIEPIHGGISCGGTMTPEGIQSPALLTTGPNLIFIQGHQYQDMYLQSSPLPPPQAQIPQIQPSSPVMQLTKPQQRMTNQIQPLLQVHPAAASVDTQTTATNTFVQTAQVPGLDTQVHFFALSRLERALTQPQLLPKPIASKLEKALVCGVAPTTTATIAAITTEPTTTTVTTTSTATTGTATASVTTNPVKEKQQTQKDIVKPHVLTHVIEEHMNQEIPEPFTVNRTSSVTESSNLKQQQQQQQHLQQQQQAEKKVDDIDAESPSPKAADYASTSNQLILQTTPDPWKRKRKFTVAIKGSEKKEKLKVKLSICEFCGKLDKRKKFKRSKRFCSISCAESYNVRCHSKCIDMESSKSSKKNHGMQTRKDWKKSSSRNAVGSPHGDNDCQNDDGESSPKEETTDSHSGSKSSLSLTTRPTSQKDMVEVDNTKPEPVPPLAKSERSKLPKHTVKWTVLDVYEFIKALPGCTDYADEFRIQEIDGRALLLLKENHLTTAMNMKLGPALKIYACINLLKKRNQ